ncbi:MAG: hypothetical protein M3Y56_12685 [Armatimonadota bacterium]|nr:hypothetical protein [Armatimonadota bacterium]
MEHLDDYAQRFANELFEAIPEWWQYVLDEFPEIFTKPVKGCLIVKVPAPVQVSSPLFGDWLLIDTCDGEVTVTFDYYHTHFDCFSDVPEELGFREAIEFIQSFVKEEFCVVVTMDGDKWLGSTTVKPDEEPDLSWLKFPCERVYIRSWKGTYDREYRVSQ